MTPTSDERREVAATLRDAKRKCDGRGYPWMTDDLILAIGYEHDYEADNGIFDRLADLIDPTCRLVNTTFKSFSDGSAAFYHELSCGHTCETVWAKPPSYCPECGARVVDEDD